MRHGTMLVPTLILGLLMASVALPPGANAGPRSLPGELFGVITKPLNAILGAGRRSGRSHRHSTASQPRPPAPVTAQSQPTAATSKPPAAAAAAGATAGVAAVAATDTKPAVAETPATEKPAPEAAPNTSKPPETATAAPPPASPPPAPAAAAPAPQAPATAAAANPTPAPASPQRSAALPQSTEQPTRRSEPNRNQANQANQAGPPAQPVRLGVVGPQAWPSAYEDVLGFTLWPAEYGERLRGHGIGDVVGTIFAPAALAARARAPGLQARLDTPNRATVGSAPSGGTCSSADAASSDWPVTQIERSIELNAAQRTALNQLKSALGDAVASIRSTCRDEAALTPVERLRAMQGTLWAVHDAATLIRAPLARFYDSLSDEQKKRFAASAAPQSDPRTMSRADMARMCGAPGSNEAATRQIEQGLQVTAAQRASLDTLQKKSFEMGQFLMASCLKPIAATPAERLDGAADRLTALIFAATNVGLALNDFYSQLSDEQKTKFNAAGR